MADEILKLANYALAIIGANRIEIITETSASTRLFNDIYEATRQEFLGSQAWRGATQTLNLVENVTTDTPDRWKKAFDVPSNVLAVWKCNDTPDTEEQPLWEPGIDNDAGTKKRLIFTDQAVIAAKCSIDLVTDIELALLTGKTLKALAFQVAAAMALGWGMSGNDLVTLDALAEKWERKAVSVNGQSGKIKKDRRRPLVDVRFEGIRPRRPF